MKFRIVPSSNMLLFCIRELLAPRPTPTLEDYPVSAVCDFLFSVSVAAIPISFIRNLRTRQAAVTTGTIHSAGHWRATLVPESLP
jgi:hypothetical protein